MTNFSWIVNQLFTQTIEGKQDYVVIAAFEVVGVDGEYTANVTGTQNFSTETVGPFVPYDELTNEIVTGWIQASLGQEAIDNIYACIQGQIDTQINPPVVPQNTPLPWV